MQIQQAKKIMAENHYFLPLVHPKSKVQVRVIMPQPMRPFTQCSKIRKIVQK